MTDTSADLAVIKAERERIRDRYLRPTGQRPASTARGLHHTALISSDVERTIRFYQELLGFPLTELIENRDYPGSSHFFFDIGHGNLLAFFDFPGLDVGPYAEVLDKVLGCDEPGTQNDPKVSRDLALAGTESTSRGRVARLGVTEAVPPSLGTADCRENSNLDCWNQQHALPGRHGALGECRRRSRRPSRSLTSAMKSGEPRPGCWHGFGS